MTSPRTRDLRKVQAEALLALLRQGQASRGADSFVRHACERARELLGADFVAVLARGAGAGYSWLGIAGNRSDVLTQRNRGLGRGPGAMAITQERTVVFGLNRPDVDGDLAGLQAMDSEGARTVMAVPLLLAGTALAYPVN